MPAQRRKKPAAEDRSRAFHALATQTAAMITKKNVAYGDSFTQACGILRILYPEGISHDQMENALTVVRIIDKLFRIAVDNDPYGESPYSDICGYALLALEKHTRRSKRRRRAR